MVSDLRRRRRRPSGQQQAIILLLRALASRLEDGSARANLRIERADGGREVWLCAASVTR